MSSACTPLHARIASSFYAGDAHEAHSLQAKSRHFFRLVTPFGWTQSIKYSLYEQGVFDSPLCRAPSKNLDAAQRSELKAIFKTLKDEDPHNFGGLLP